jgi:hypothetical protein
MRRKKGKTYERAPWRGVSSWLSFHPTRVACEAGAGGGVVPIVHRVSSAVVHRVSSPVICRHSTYDPPHEQLLVRLGQVVHRRMSSIVVVPSRLLFPHRLLSVIPSVVRCCCCHRRTALVHPQSTRRAVAHQHGGGCSVDHRRRPHRRCLLFVVIVPVHCHSSFVIIVPVVIIRRSSLFVRPSPFLIHPSVVLHCLSSIPSFHLQSTPRAVAREAGGGWRCRCWGWWR